MLFHFFRNKQTKKQNQAFQPSREEPFIPISKSLKENEQQITTILHNNPDMFKRSFQIKFEKDGLVNISLFGIDGLIDESAIHSQVIEPLISDPISLNGTIIESVKNKVYLKEIQAVIDLQQAVFSILKGATLLLIDGQSQARIVAGFYQIRFIFLQLQ
ncbi:MAG: spore germination protein [Bacillaceae bacterium]|nr:spore germination protein [Bacillaceae bacterium]